MLEHYLTEDNCLHAHIVAVLVSLSFFILSHLQLVVTQGNYAVVEFCAVC